MGVSEGSLLGVVVGDGVGCAVGVSLAGMVWVGVGKGFGVLTGATDSTGVSMGGAGLGEVLVVPQLVSTRILANMRVHLPVVAIRFGVFMFPAFGWVIEYVIIMGVSTDWFL